MVINSQAGAYDDRPDVSTILNLYGQGKINTYSVV